MDSTSRKAAPVPVVKKRPLDSKASPPDQPARASVRPPAKAGVPYSEWEETRISEIFGVTLNVSSLAAGSTDVQKETAMKADWRLCWLKDLEQEMSSEGSYVGNSHLTIRLESTNDYSEHR